MKTRTKFVIGGAVILAVIVALSLQELQKTTVFFYTPTEVLASPAEFEEKTIRGTLIGSRKDMQDVIKISAENNFEVVTETFPLEQANQALQKLKTSDIEARAVLIP